jgi:hypothetical protein
MCARKRLWLVALVAFSGCESEGPLAGPPGSGGPAKMGQIFVIGIVTPRNGADEDAVFQWVQSSDSDAVQGLELRFAAVPDTGRCPIGSAYGWPPHGCRERLRENQRLQGSPGEGGVDFVGASAPQPGTWFVPAFKLEYKIDWREHTTVLEQGLELRVSGSGA